MHESHLEVNFRKNYKKEETEIEQLTRSIRKTFNRCFQSVSVLRGDTKILKNAKSDLIAKIENYQKEFTMMQLDYSESNCIYH